MILGRRSWYAITAALVLVRGTLAYASAEAEPVDVRPQEGRATVTLDESGCRSVSRPELRRLVGIELGSLLVPAALDPDAADPLDVARLSLICDETRAVIRVRARSSASAARLAEPRTIEREVNLADFPEDAVARGLTLAAIELLATLETTVREKVGGEPPATVPPTPPGDRASFSTAVVVVRREFLGAAGLGAWGGRVDVLRDQGRWRIAGDVEGDASGSAVSLLGAARAVLGSVAGFAGARFAPASNVVLSLAAGARGGVTRMRGVPVVEGGATGATIWRPWWGPALSTRARVGGAGLAASASLELGVTAAGAEALSGTDTVLAVRGPWLTAALGLEF